MLNKLGLLVVFLQLSALAFSDDGSSCVDNYLDFEEQTFGNNSENRLTLICVSSNALVLAADTIDM